MPPDARPGEAANGSTADAAAGTRQLLAVFANPQARFVAAHLMLGEELDAALENVPKAKRAKVRDSLIAAGLVRDSGARDDAIFRKLLAANAPAKKTGIDRFLEGGRIIQYPANLTEREEVLAWVARTALKPGEVLSEPKLNERLEHIHPDVAVLRRYLVDFRFVEREADGSGYSLVPENS